jgi:hypothetical protein
MPNGGWVFECQIESSTNDVLLPQNFDLLPHLAGIAA